MRHQMDRRHTTCGFAAVAAFAAVIAFAPIRGNATTYAFSTGYSGDHVHLSDPSNYYSKVVPPSDIFDAKLRMFMGGKYAENDLPSDHLLLGIEFTSAPNDRGGHIDGNPFNIGVSGIGMTTAASDATYVATQVFNTAVNIATNTTVAIIPAAKNCLRFNGPIGVYGDPNDCTNKLFKFNGAGEAIIAGGLTIPTETGYETRQQFLAGTVRILSDVTVPSFSFEGSVHVILDNGATLKNTSKWTSPATLHSFFNGTSVFDIIDGKFLPESAICTAQTKESDTAINLYGTSVIDTGNKGLRLANNGKATINIYDSARFFKRNNGNEAFAERGQTIFNLLGGKLICGNNRLGGGVMQLGYNAASVTTNFPPSVLNLAGGELYMTQFKNDTANGALLERPLYVYLDGTAWRCTATGDAFLFGGGCNATTGQLRVHMRAGGFTIDTRQFDITWNAIPVLGSDLDGGTDGDLVKTGFGKLTVATNFTFIGTTVVKGGTLQVNDGNFIAGGVDLRPSTTLSFTGTTLSLASLSSKGGIVKLTSGQSLALAAAPSVDGLLVFDVPVTDGTSTLIVAPGMDAGVAALCAVKTPVAGKSCTFAVQGGSSLTLTVADGDAPAAPTFPPSEDPELIVTSGTVTFGDDGWESLAASGGTLAYNGDRDLVLGPDTFRLGANATFSLTGAGSVTFTGGVDAVFSSDHQLTLKTAATNAFSFAGEWLDPVWPRESAWNNFKFYPGNFIFGPDLSPDDFFERLTLYPITCFTVKETDFSLAATTPSAAVNPSSPGERTSFILDGARLKVTGAGSGSLDNYLAGVTSFGIGAGGGSIDTCGNDATITQTLLPTGATTGVFAKLGEGTLTMSGAGNVIDGTLAVSNGTLVAAFDTGSRRPYPEGAMAIWDFDGEDPYADRTGHGYNLVQAHPETVEVDFTDANALSGKAAKWSDSTLGGALKATNITSTAFFRQSISAWVRFNTLTMHGGNINILSTRCKNDWSSTGNNFDLAYKSISKTNGVSIAEGSLKGFGTIWNAAQSTIWDYLVGHAPSVGEWHHVVMVNDYGHYKSYLDGVCYVDQSAGATPGFLSSGYLITLGQGIATGEKMNKGGMLDEVAIYNRALTDADVAALYRQGTSKRWEFDLSVAEGAVWDMNASTATVRTVSGGGTVQNGKIVVAERLVTTTDAAIAVDKVSFGTGGTIDLGYGETERRTKGRRVLMTFSELDAEGRAAVKGWRLENTGASIGSTIKLRIVGNALCLDVMPRGIMLRFR